MLKARLYPGGRQKLVIEELDPGIASLPPIDKGFLDGIPLETAVPDVKS